jgi:hydrogenase maturation protein HypF
MVDAANDEAVSRLRVRKHREEKPFAVMAPALESVRMLCEVSTREERLLVSPESPIVLLRSRPNNGIAALVASRNPNLGVMLPYTPLHHILMNELVLLVARAAIVPTSPLPSMNTMLRNGSAKLQTSSWYTTGQSAGTWTMPDCLRFPGRPQIIRRARLAPLPIAVKMCAAHGRRRSHLKNTGARAGR